MANFGDEAWLRKMCEIEEECGPPLAGGPRRFEPVSTLALCCGQPPRQFDQHGQTLILCTACARTVGGPIGTVARAWGVLVQ